MPNPNMHGMVLYLTGDDGHVRVARVLRQDGGRIEVSLSARTDEAPTVALTLYPHHWSEICRAVSWLASGPALTPKKEAKP